MDRYSFAAAIEDWSESKGTESAKQYLDWLRTTVSDLSGSVRRTVTLLILLMAAFEFINESPRAAVALGGFHITKGSIVLLFVPALVAYLFFQAVTDSAKLRRSRIAFTIMFSSWSQSTGGNGSEVEQAYSPGFGVIATLVNLAVPTDPPFWTAGGQVPEEAAAAPTAAATAGQRIVLSAPALFTILVVASTLAFEAHAYYVLFDGKTLTSHILWGSNLLMSIVFLSLSALVTFGRRWAD